MTNILEVSNLSVVDKDKEKLLDDISFSIEKGSSLGIIGESGSGKSLLVKTSLGFLPKGLKASYEKISLFGKDVYDISRNKSKKLIGENVGYIAQNTVEYLHPLIKIQDQISDGFIDHKLGNKKEAREKALDLLELVGIDDPDYIMSLYPNELSGGLKQRVNIATALMVDPLLFIADEPTTALDPKIQYQVMELLRKNHERTKNSMVIISHDLSLIKNYCENVLVIYNGVVQEKGKVENIFNNPKSDYAKALLDVNVKFDQDKTKPLKDIRGYLKTEV